MDKCIDDKELLFAKENHPHIQACSTCRQKWERLKGLREAWERERAVLQPWKERLEQGERVEKAVENLLKVPREERMFPLDLEYEARNYDTALGLIRKAYEYLIRDPNETESLLGFAEKLIQSLENRGEKDPWIRGKLALNWGSLWGLRGYIDRAEEYYIQAKQCFQSIGDELQVGKAYMGLMYTHLKRNQSVEALQLGRKTLKIFKTYGDESYRRFCLNDIALIYFAQGKVLRMEWILNILLRNTPEDHPHYPTFLSNQSLVAIAKEDYRLAFNWVDRALSLHVDRGNEYEVTRLARMKGYLMIMMGNPQSSFFILERCLLRFREMGCLIDEMLTNLFMGYAWIKIGDFLKALARLQNVRAFAAQVGMVETFRILMDSWFEACKSLKGNHPEDEYFEKVMSYFRYAPLAA